MRNGTTIRDRHRGIIARGQPPCGICGHPIDYSIKYPHPDSFVVDHIIPLVLGGTNDLSNKQAAHRRCNSEKAGRLTTATIKRSGSLRR